MTYIPESLRREVRDRAKGSCEYCLINEDFASRPHEFDHVYAEKHEGPTIGSNLCLCCVDCNRYKGSDLCSIDPLSGELVRLFHPLRDSWLDHFVLVGATIEPLTSIARATIKVLNMNEPERVLERESLVQLGLYP
jgi:hypothetical protein